MINKSIKALKDEDEKVILNAGDILDSVRPTPEILKFLNQMQYLLIKNQVRMLITSGNHDLIVENHWIECLEIEGEEYGFKLINDTIVTLKNGLKIQGVPFIGNESVFLDRIKNMDECGIVLCHEATRELCPFNHDRDFSVKDLCYDKFNTMLIGDIHTRYTFDDTYEDEEFKIPKGKVIHSPGSIETCNVSENNEFTVTLFEVDTDGVVTEEPKFIDVQHRELIKTYIKSEEDIDDFIKEMRKDKLKDSPIVYIRFDPTVPNVIPRLNTALFSGHSAIAKYKVDRLTKDNNGVKAANEESECLLEDTSVETFVDKFIDPESEKMEHELFTSILNGSDPFEATDKFIKEKEKELVG
jgi:DNA repair exonuclease SbcCD nuclease subunit